MMIVTVMVAVIFFSCFKMNINPLGLKYAPPPRKWACTFLLISLQRRNMVQSLVESVASAPLSPSHCDRTWLTDGVMRRRIFSVQRSTIPFIHLTLKTLARDAEKIAHAAPRLENFRQLGRLQLWCVWPNCLFRQCTSYTVNFLI